MQRENGSAPEHYRAYVGRKIALILGGVVLAVIMFFVSVSVGAVSIPVPDIIATLLGGQGTGLYERIIWSIRIPQALTAIVAGAGLAIAGVAMQSILRNPLASPFTLGLSNAPPFGAAIL
ncbi:MAG TPA: iron chelate uptake ABC transporter family permease subunit, partial [Methanocorpusculum sp.]|nr:iron chelate uptake ABC transporter family permease subunit [Methanocorpusculum sp.]